VIQFLCITFPEILIKIDSDLFGSKENKTKLVQTLTEIWRSNPQNEVKTTIRRIEN
jgi:hypothetical protein